MVKIMSALILRKTQFVTPFHLIPIQGGHTAPLKPHWPLAELKNNHRHHQNIHGTSNTFKKWLNWCCSSPKTFYTDLICHFIPSHAYPGRPRHASVTQKAPIRAQNYQKHPLYRDISPSIFEKWLSHVTASLNFTLTQFATLMYLLYIQRSHAIH